MRLVNVALGAIVLLFAHAVAADSHMPGKPMIDDPYARASIGMAKSGAAYMTIMNRGEDDRLIAARSDVSARTEIHGHFMDANGVAKMRPVDGIDVERGASVQLKPGGLHVMFMGLKEPLREGSRFPLTLVFEQAGEVTVEVKVRGIAAGAGQRMQHGHGAQHKTN